MRAFLAALACLSVGTAAAETVSRGADHDGYGRLVFEFDARPALRSEQHGDTVTLHFTSASPISVPATPVRNVLRVKGGAGEASVTLAPGAQLRLSQIGNRVVLDALDPPHRARAAAQGGNGLSRTRIPDAALPWTPPPVTASQAMPPQAVPEKANARPPPAEAPAAAGGAQPAPDGAFAPPLPAPPQGPVELAARPVPPDPAEGRPANAVLVPFGPDVAAAAFRQGGELWVVFDERRPIDVAGFPDRPPFAGAKVELLPAATLLRLTPRPGRRIGLDHVADGWVVASRPDSERLAAVMPALAEGRLLVAMPKPGGVVAVPDPESGRNLLVGTLRGAGPGVPAAVRSPGLLIRPSLQGVVVEPVSDSTVLRSVRDGFALATAPVLASTRAVIPAGPAATLTRRFDFAAEPASVLLRRLQVQVEDIGRAPAQARLEPRKRAAQTMLSLGLAAEAQSLLKLALEEDPRGAADPEAGGLAAIAALLAGRPDEAAGLDAPALSGTDEVAFWRAARTAMADERDPKAAAVFATTYGLAQSYPAALRGRMLPLAAETMALGGAPAAADAMLAGLPDEKSLTLARAIRLEQTGNAEAALPALDSLAASRDRLLAARAGVRATELRLSTGAIKPAEAADQLERSVAGWRGDARERDLRLRTADVQAQAGQWRKAFDTLRATTALFPADSAQVSAQSARLLHKLLRGPDAKTVKPLDLVALAGENAEVIASAKDPALAALLAEKLVALDLPGRAGPVIERMVTASPPGAARSALGLRLAALRFDERDVAAAAAALAMTADDPAAAPLAEERALLDARIRAARHDVAGAAAVLAQIDSAAADSLRATVLADSGDWHGAAVALASLATRQVPDAGPLTPEQQDVLLRLASAQSRAGDGAALLALGVSQGARMSGPAGDMFRLLTGAPVRSPADLPRNGSDIALAKALPSSLDALRGR